MKNINKTEVKLNNIKVLERNRVSVVVYAHPNIIIGPTRLETIGTAIATNMALGAGESIARTMEASDNPIISNVGTTLRGVFGAAQEGEPTANSNLIGENVGEVPTLPPPSNETPAGQVIPTEVRAPQKITVQGPPITGPAVGIIASTVAAAYLAKQGKRFFKRQPRAETIEASTTTGASLGGGFRDTQVVGAPVFETDRNVRGAESINRQLIDEGGPVPSAPPAQDLLRISPDGSLRQASNYPLVPERAATGSSVGIENLWVTQNSSSYTTSFDQGVQVSPNDFSASGAVTEAITPLTQYPSAGSVLANLKNTSAGSETIQAGELTFSIDSRIFDTPVVVHPASVNAEGVAFKIEVADGFVAFIDSLPGSNYAWRIMLSFVTNRFLTPIVYKTGCFLFTNLGKGLKRIFSSAEGQTPFSLNNNLVPASNNADNLVPDEVLPPVKTFTENIETFGDRVLNGDYTEEQLKGLLAKLSVKLSDDHNIIIWAMPATWVVSGKKILLLIVYGCAAVIVILVTVGVVYYGIKFYKSIEKKREEKLNKKKNLPEGKYEGPYYNGKQV